MATTAAPAAPTEGHLKRKLTLLDLTMASVGGIIGSGWLYGSMRSAAIAGPSAVISWLIGGVAVILIGLVFAELGGAVPESGALVRYPQYSHGTFVSFVLGWAAILGFASVPPIEAEAATQYANYYIHGLYVNSVLSGWGLLVAFVLMVLFFLLNYWSVNVFAKTNTIWTLIKIAIPVVTFVVLFITSFHGSNFSSTSPGGFAPNGTSAIMKAVPLGGIIFAYFGFRQAVDFAGEAIHPQRDVPRAILISILLCVVLYLCLQTSWIVAMPQSALAHGWSGINFSSPFANLLLTVGLGWWAVFLFADAIWSPAGTGNVYSGTTARTILAMSRNGYFPKVFTHINPKTGIPSAAMIATVILGLVFLLPLPSWALLVGVVSNAYVITFTSGPIAAAVLRRTAPELKRPFKLGGMSIISPIAFVLCSLIIYWTGWTDDWIVLLGTLLGVVFYAYGVSSFATDRMAEFGGKHLKAGIWLVVWLVVELLMAAFGSKDFGAPHQIIPYPWDLVVIIVYSIGFYYWAIHSGWKTPDTERILRGEFIDDPNLEIKA